MYNIQYQRKLREPRSACRIQLMSNRISHVLLLPSPILKGNDPPMVDAVLVGEEPTYYVVGSTPAPLADAIPTAVAIGSNGAGTTGNPANSTRTTQASQGRRVNPSPQAYQSGSFIATTTYYLPVMHAESEPLVSRPNLGRCVRPVPVCWHVSVYFSILHLLLWETC